MMYKINNNGHIINEASRDKINQYYLTIINEIIAYYRIYLKNDILSIYVRGSVPLGLAKKNISDIDIIAITKKKLPEKKLKWILNISKKLKTKYPQITLFDLTTISLNELLYSESYNMLKFHTKTNAALLFGENICKHINNYSVGKPLVKILYPHFDIDLKNLKKLLLNKRAVFLFAKKPTKFWCIWIMRDIIRAGGALAAADDNIYTRDLQDCYKLFALKYPQYSQEMHQALNWALKPINNKTRLVKYLDDFTPKLIVTWKNIINN